MKSPWLFDLDESPINPSWWLLATSAQQAKLYALSQAGIFAKAKVTNIYTNSQYAFEISHDFGCYGSNRFSLLAAETKFKMVLMSKVY